MGRGGPFRVALAAVAVDAAVLLSAVAVAGRFRVLALGALAAMLLGGAGASAAMAGPGEGATPWAGAWERLSACACVASLLALGAAQARPAEDARPAASPATTRP